ncbi:hypothetical protein LWI28_008485 [Acer negundo]|uniref:Uncharacterized protein n=1 Tax=Acer negundo TaxID=4023 RepID=A0AAD5IVD7_ACENE|nr:hypothetical protein LWI28_008485 [Acer negundo]
MENNNLITSKMLQTMVAIIVSLVLMLSLSPSMAVTVDDTEESSLLSTYIVYVTKPEGGENSMQSVDLDSFYQSFLPVSLSSSDREQRLVYSYRNVVNGMDTAIDDGADVLSLSLGIGSAPAIDDGADVLSLSLGGGSAPFYADSIAMGAFSATQKGIFVSCSAGNEGPSYGTLSNEAPWILTVGASTVDRIFLAAAQLGNGKVYEGESIFQPKDFPSTQLPLVYAGANGNESAALCAAGSLSSSDVQGKIVLCERGGGIGRIEKGQTVKDAGGVALILMNDELNGYSTLADPHRNVSCSNESSIPEAQLNYPSFSIIFGSTPQTYTRTVTYVGQGNAIYNVEVVSPEGVDVTVKPEQIMFTETNQKATFSVTFTKTQNTGGGSFSQGYLNWVSGLHTVRSPIVVIFE